MQNIYKILKGKSAPIDFCFAARSILFFRLIVFPIRPSAFATVTANAGINYF
jgi:hypothetical protein